MKDIHKMLTLNPEFMTIITSTTASIHAVDNVSTLLQDFSNSLEYIPAEKESHKAMGNSPK
jgi:hypothetical protein